MKNQLLKNIVDTGNFYSVMERMNEYEEDLWDTWSEKREDAFETKLRQTVQEIEQVKDVRHEYNVSIQYQIGKLDGWTEAFERLYRAEESASKAAGALSCLGEKAKMIMECLRKNKEGMRHGELAAAIGSSDSSLTNIMKRVLLSGAVESVRSGKNTIYYLTDVGRRYCQGRFRGMDDKEPEGTVETVQAEQEKSENSEWISIDEKEPPLSSCVLTYYKCSENFYTMEVLYYGFLDGKNRFFTFDISSGEEIYKPFVTHWMPLPEPPEDVK